LEGLVCSKSGCGTTLSDILETEELKLTCQVTPVRKLILDDQELQFFKHEQNNLSNVTNLGNSRVLIKENAKVNAT